MAEIRAFYCGRCRAEVVAKSRPLASMNPTRWTPPVLCCGEPLRALETGDVGSLLLAHQRVACCPQCGLQLNVVVHPAAAFFCQVCQRGLIISPRMPVGHLAHNEQVSGNSEG